MDRIDKLEAALEKCMEELLQLIKDSPKPEPCISDWLGAAEVLLDEVITTIHRYQDGQKN